MGRVVGGFLIFAGIGTLSLFTAATAAYLIQIGGLDALRARRISDHVVICGLGNVGVLLRTGLPPRGLPGPGRGKGGGESACHRCPRIGRRGAHRRRRTRRGPRTRTTAVRKAHRDRRRRQTPTTWKSPRRPARSRGRPAEASPARRRFRIRNSGTRCAAGMSAHVTGSAWSSSTSPSSARARCSRSSRRSRRSNARTTCRRTC